MSQNKAEALIPPASASERTQQIENVITALMQIAEHDWRISHLAHTSDTAEQAASWLRTLLRECPDPKPLERWGEWRPAR